MTGTDMAGRPEAWRPAPDRRQFAWGLAATLIALPAAAQPAGNAGEAARITPAPADPPHVATPGIPAGGTHAVQLLRASTATLPLKPAPAAETDVWAFNGTVPGPLLRVRQGGRVDVEVTNGLSEPLSLHWQGAGAPNAEDGVAGLTGPAIAPGDSRSISFQANRAGFFWYRPMTIGSVARQTERGLYGVLIVDEPEPPPVEHDLVLVLDDWALDDAAQLRPDFDSVAARSGLGRLGNWLTLNSAAPPERVTVTPGARLRLRLLNAANARHIPIQFSGLVAQVIGIDGRPSEVFRPARDSLTLQPGARYDLIVEAPKVAGTEGTVSASLGAGMPLLTVTVEGVASSQPASNIQALSAPDLPAAISLQNAVRAKLDLAGGMFPDRPEEARKLTDPARVWTINGISWPDALAKPAFSVKSGRPVTLELKNVTASMQTLHIHGHHVRRLHNLDDGWDPYWLDVIAIPAGQIARVAFIAAEPGKWLVGSAIAERLDGGMATWFEVRP